jgi:colicin import membrane protein
MENRPLSLAACLIFLALPAIAALAAEEVGSAAQRADWAQRLQKAQALTAEGQAREAAAAKVREAKDGECPKRFQVNACLGDNQDEYNRIAHQAKHLETEGQAIEREVRKEQLKAKDVRHDVESARREAELPGREAETSAARQAAQTREASMRADKEIKAEAGRQRKAADEEKLRQRQAAHAARVAEKMQKAQPAAGAPGTTGK